MPRKNKFTASKNHNLICTDCGNIMGVQYPDGCKTMFYFCNCEKRRGKFFQAPNGFEMVELVEVKRHRRG